MKKLLIAFLFGLIFDAHAVSVFYAGNDYLARTEGQQITYILGISDAHQSLRGGLFCVPKDVTAQQLRAVVTKYLNNNPEKLHLSAASLIMVGLNEAFPCK